jgi:hypothetical protein
MLNVGKRSVERAREVVDHGVPDLVDAVEQGEVTVSAAAEFAKVVAPLDQARLIGEHGSPAAAVKATVTAKADRAANKMLRPIPDPKPAADRAEAKTELGAARAAYVAAIKVANLTIPERVKEMKLIMDATGVKLLRDFGITWTKIKRAQRARRSGKKARA